MLKRCFSTLRTKGYPDCHRSILEAADESQKKSFEESLIMVDEDDNQVSSVSKVDAHLKINKNNLPHRAFSVFLFNQENKLLLQKRSEKKITFPNLWSNTCCSHPLNNQEESEIKENIGIKKAAVRRVKFELGINTHVKDFILNEKILYRADSDNVFEEYELDYILIGKITLEKIDLFNKDEVSDVDLVNEKELNGIIKENKINITPWFQLILNKRMSDIYKLADLIGSNADIKESEKIVKFI
jgi:isopentenyl-diphosphate delta-isomerase